MRIVSKKNIKKTNQTLLEVQNEKVFSGTSFLSMALYKKEGNNYVLYPIPTRSINSLDYNQANGNAEMQQIDPSPLKITNFLITKTASDRLSGKDKELVLISYFDYNAFETYLKFSNTTNNDTKYDAKRYKTNIASHHTDKFCIIIDTIIV